MKNRKRSVANLQSQPAAIASETAVVNQPGWFYGSLPDLMIGCGAWSAPLLLLAYYCSANYPRGVSLAFYGLALVCNYPHYMATIYRAYRTKEDFAKYKIFTLHLTLLIGVLVIIAHVSYQLLAVVFTLYLTWSPFHYSGQNFGIALMFARRNGVKTTREGRRAFYLAFLSSYAMFFLAVHSFASSDQFIITLGIPLKVARIAWVLMLTIFAAATASSLSGFVKQTSWRAMTAPVVMLSTQVAWFVIPTALTLFTDIDFLHARATAGILALMHSAQYLWITSYYARREAAAASGVNALRPKSWRAYSYAAVLIIGGVALFVPGPWLASRVMHIDFAASFLAFTALVNIHHFILDGAIWKLRDGRIAALLLNTAVEKREGLASGFNNLTAWLTSTRTSARLFRVAAAFSLLLLAGLDQVKFYYGTEVSNAAGLRRAQQLNPYDAGVQLRLARVSADAGNRDDHRAALEEAVRINPAYRQAQAALAKLLIESGKYEEAYAHYQQMFAHLNPDVDSLVNFGLLASQLNHTDEAVSAWQQALSLDASQANAHLYLADLLAQKNRPKEAMNQYEQYLALIADSSRAMVTRPSPEALVKVILRLAVTCQQAGEDQTALQFFAQAAKLAQSVGDNQGLVTALIDAAELKAHQGNRAEAAADFQQALRLEKSSTIAAQAAHWFAYAEFLQQVKAPPRLIFACLTKADVLLHGDKDPVGDVPKDLPARTTFELNSTASTLEVTTTNSIKTDLNPVLQEALALKF
jgi:tetratricopeptide (TPR) repeat protein